MSGIKLDQLCFTYPDSEDHGVVLDHIQLEIRDGEFVCVIGHSGCGKSTLLNIIAGLRHPTCGYVAINDQPIIRPEAGRGMVFQHYSLFPWMTVEKNVLFGLKHAQIPISKKEAQHRAADFLRRVDMLEERKKYPYQLSGGMQQRVAIARALAMDADILLLDEPFGALDIKKRLELQKLLEELWDSGIKRKTVVFVTHDIEEAILLADRIIFMDKGRIEQEIMVPYSRPRNRGVILQSKSYQEIHQKLLHLFYQSGDFIHEQKAI